MSERLSKDAVRFVVAGGLNTALTSAAYFVLVLALSPEIAYAISWALGLIFVVAIYPNRVFVGGRKSWMDRIILGTSTVAVFVLGLIILRALTAFWNSPQLAFVVTLASTTLANFLLGRFVLRRPNLARASPPVV